MDVKEKLRQTNHDYFKSSETPAECLSATMSLH